MQHDAQGTQNNPRESVMNRLPSIPTKTIILQIITATVLCVSLACYIWQQNVHQQLEKSQNELLRHQSQLRSIEEQQKKYNELYKQYAPFIHAKWKHMAFQWDDITFQELQHRIDTLYSDCSILLPEGLEIQKAQPASDAQQTAGADGFKRGYTIKLKMAGQWLCTAQDE